MPKLLRESYVDPRSNPFSIHLYHHGGFSSLIYSIIYLLETIAQNKFVSAERSFSFVYFVCNARAFVRTCVRARAHACMYFMCLYVHAHARVHARTMRVYCACIHTRIYVYMLYMTSNDAFKRISILFGITSKF